MITPKTYVCEECKGSGGFDAASDCEVYDEWIMCEFCDVTGEIEGE